MDKDPTSLSNLHDLAVPPDVSWWPLAPGWWVLIVATIALACWILRLALQHRQANAYRREALEELETVNDIMAIDTLLRRCALVVAGRPEIAKLTGDAWTDWLSDQTTEPPSETIKHALVSGPYLQSTPSESMHQLKQFAKTWIRTHQLTADRKSLITNR